jgi:hypothetical protein
MKKYILILFGEVSEEIMLETLSDLEKVSDNIRFFTGPGHGIYHFESKDNATEIKNIIIDYLEDTVQSVFVFSLEGDYAIGMDEELRRYFLDAKFGNESSTERLDKLKETYIDFIKNTEEDNIEEKIGVIPLKELLKRHLDGLPDKPLSVDCILDKILEKGLESLTKREKNFLDNQKRILDGKK